jgi:predicted nucleic acid-binding protein
MNVEFIDTNLLVYAFDRADRLRHSRAEQIIRSLTIQGRGGISMQVLTEFYSVATRKLSIPADEARSILTAFDQWVLHIPNRADLMRASFIQQQLQISWWDALIVNSAQQVNASILWTEDLNHNQRIGNLTIRNPFLD